ncbi:hypothetical protein QJS04_geneDACA009164 [Acorus gramineus]|uniref:Dirigent protein n=1 Tax=Acorus gramineus TaxID=55184 RepID=A0AAV9AQJ2_ACOGR|nr:hypothetical protein QJS04_geneDACA009164 [Acorus gramineus]
MACHTKQALLSLSLHLLLLLSSTTQGAKPMKHLKLKTTHLHFYFHDTVAGRNATAVLSAHPPNPYPTRFGNVFVIDDPLTEGPEPTSRRVGRAQGMYAFAARDEFSVLMAVDYAFTEGEFRGSGVSVLGRNPVTRAVREFPVVGGSGKFRLARGYALARTRWFDSAGDAVVEYDMFVMHY